MLPVAFMPSKGELRVVLIFDSGPMECTQKWSQLREALMTA